MTIERCGDDITSTTKSVRLWRSFYEAGILNVNIPGVQSVMHKINANLKRPTRILYGISVMFSLVPLISVVHVWM